jgi:Flp pilus assembly protein TadG
VRAPRTTGQALVETALVLPLLLTVSLGLLQVALYAHARDVLLVAAQEGARLAAEDGRGLHDGLARVSDLAAAGLGTSVEPLSTQAVVERDIVQVTIDTHLRPILPLPIADGLPLHVQASVARERFRPAGGSP